MTEHRICTADGKPLRMDAPQLPRLIVGLSDLQSQCRACGLWHDGSGCRVCTVKVTDNVFTEAK